jgi:DNA-directed RNA polymerase sigma subunit (sigma70/sigma32)
VDLDSLRNNLTQEEFKLIDLRYDVDNNGIPMTLNEIAIMKGESLGNVNKKINKIIKKIKQLNLL